MNFWRLGGTSGTKVYVAQKKFMWMHKSEICLAKNKTADVPKTFMWRPKSPESLCGFALRDEARWADGRTNGRANRRTDGRMDNTLTYPKLDEVKRMVVLG